MARLALEPHHCGNHPGGGGLLHPCIRVLHLLCREHSVRVAVLRAAYPLPSEYHGLLDEPAATVARLRFPSLWTRFCQLRTGNCALLTLTGDPNIQEPKLGIQFKENRRPRQCEPD